MAEIKKIDIKEFRELGFLQEINRLFLHPLGMALEVILEDDGTEKLGGIWDYRDDPEGMIYGEMDDTSKSKIAFFKEFAERKHAERLKRLGYIIQEP
jgi:hypothetical protein